MVDKVLNENETIVAVPVLDINGTPYLVSSTGVIPFTTGPTVAMLNYWQAIRNTSGAVTQGGNISRAIRDDLSLGLTDSDTDDDRDINTAGSSLDLTTRNYEAELTGFRDIVITDAGVYNLFRDLFRAPDALYALFHRTGYAENAVFATGQEVWGYLVATDNPVPGYKDGGNQTVGQNFISKNQVLPAFVLA